MKKIAAALLEREVLDGDEMERVLKGEILPPLKPVEPEPKEKAAPKTEQPGDTESPISGLGPIPPPTPRPAGA